MNSAKKSYSLSKLGHGKIALSLLSLLIVSLLAFVVWASHQANSYQLGGDLGIVAFGLNPSLLNPAIASANINISRSDNFTLVLNTSNASLQHIQNVSIMFYPRNLSFSVVANLTLSNVSGEGGCANAATNGQGWNCTNRSYWNFSLSSITIADGGYNLTVLIANDTGISGAGANSSFAFNITMDNTPPNVTNIRFGNYTTSGINFSNHLVGTTLNTILPNITVVVNESLTYVEYVAFNLTNSSGNITPHDQANRNNTIWNISSKAPDGGNNYRLTNLSSLPEGFYILTVLTNDSVGNRNYTGNFTFRIDRTAPAVTVDCGGPYTSGQTVSCTCTASDTGGSLIQTGPRFSDGDSTESTTATGSGGTSSGCEAIDYAGNVKSATDTWTVTAASSGGGGSGGSGGGASSGVSSLFAKKVWTSINTDETASVPVSNGVIGVTEVSFSVQKTTYGAWVQVKKVDSLPSSVASFSGQAYKNIEITQGNVEKALKGDATIKFKVEKSWLADKGLSNAEVALFRYVAGKWTELSTTVAQDDGTYVHYAAMTPGFSYFVIGEAAAPAAASPAEEVAAPAPEAPAEEAPAAPEAPAEEAGRFPVWLVPVLVVLAIAALLYWYWKRK